MRTTSLLVLVGLGSLIGAIACGSSDVSCEDDGTCGGSGGTGGTGGSGATGGTSGTGGGGGTTGGGGTGATGGVSGSGGDSGTCDATKSPSEEACVVSDQYGVFVSPSGSDATGDGSKGSPYASIGKALGSAGSKKKVFVCADGGSYAEKVTMGAASDGIALHGGFKCADWSYSTSLKAKIASPETVGVEIKSLVTGTTIEDFEVQSSNASGTDAQGNGNSSIAMLVVSAQKIALKRVKLQAGTGAPGAKGSEATVQAETGEAGKQGSNACSSPSLGGAVAVTKCGGQATTSIGGQGGPGGIGASKGGDGMDGQPPSTTGGQGGKGEDVSPFTCVTGNGTPGTPGTPGGGAKSSGTLAASGFVPASGKPAGDGGTGQGGGGGGGAKAPALCSNGTAPATGASGGSGGGGGCGGKAGGGGGGGGASIALASVNSDVVMTDTDLVAQDGGGGGSGGQGQKGGKGGATGSAGTGTAASSDACPGGQGGAGGNGGPGGGGAGGPSVAIAYVGTKPVRTGGSVAHATTAATGGADGLGQTSGAGAGVAGVIAEEHAF